MLRPRNRRQGDGREIDWRRVVGWGRNAHSVAIGLCFIKGGAEFQAFYDKKCSILFQRLLSIYSRN